LSPAKRNKQKTNATAEATELYVLAWFFGYEPIFFCIFEGYFYMEIWFGRTASSSVFFNRKSLLIPVGNITHFSSATDYDDRRGFVQIGETGRDRGGGGAAYPTMRLTDRQQYTHDWQVRSGTNVFYITGTSFLIPASFTRQTAFYSKKLENFGHCSS
jgi:hypothetical protein